MRRAGAGALRGGEFDRWGVEVRRGLLGGGRLRMLVEELIHFGTSRDVLPEWAARV